MSQKVPKLSYILACKNYSQMQKKLKSISWTPISQTKRGKPKKKKNQYEVRSLDKKQSFLENVRVIPYHGMPHLS